MSLSVSVVIPMHNEEDVAADVLQALVNSDYDNSKLEILAIDDRSERVAPDPLEHDGRDGDAVRQLE